jgi:predicted PolB exonuclease-like 3'-5' exonuclease
VFNGKNFDIPIIANRCLKHVSPSMMSVIPWQTKTWEDDKVFDIFHAFPANEKYPKMDHIANFLGLGGKGEMDGSKVLPTYKDGNYALIEEYVKEDVILTREIATYMGVL